MTPKESIRWEVERVTDRRPHQYPLPYSPASQPTLAGLAVVVASLLLLGVVVYQLVDGWIRW